MSFLIAVAALLLLMLAAYRGLSVIVFAPLIAMLAVFVTDPGIVPAVFSGLFLEKMSGFIKAYFPVFLLGALFGKLVELAGFSQTITRAVIRLVGPERVVLAIVLVTALLTYGGVSVYVVAFAVYPFAADLFRQADLPKRLIPASIALGALTFAMDALPGSPQIQNIIPSTFFNTDAWAAPLLGLCGGLFVFIAGMAYLQWRCRRARAAGEGYGDHHLNEPSAPLDDNARGSLLVALLPLVAVVACNLALTRLIPQFYDATVEVGMAGLEQPLTVSVPVAVWAILGALLIGIALVLLLAFGPIRRQFSEGCRAAVGGAMLATLNTASEYGFGAVMAALPGFIAIKNALAAIPNPLVNEAITVTTLAAITGSASGGLSIALAAMSEQFLAAGSAAHIPPEVLHRVAAMASGGMDTLPHNGAIITLLAVTGLTHRQSYGDIFAITGLKTVAVFFVIAVYYLTGIV